MPASRRAMESAAAMRVDDAATAPPWYLEATPLATLPWLIRLRWATAVVEASIVVVAWTFPALDLPLDHLTVLLIAAAASNAAIAAWLARGRAVPHPAALGALGVDVLLLTGLLELTGGPSNPFTVVYAVQIALAAFTLGAVWAGLLGGLAACCYGVLIYWHTQELVPSHHRLNDFPTHLFTIWFSAAVSAELFAYFVVRVSDALARRERELEVMRTRAARADRIVSLTTLAAGAAHELSTPLATIAITARELERAATSPGPAVDLAEDAHLIRREVDRCRAILDQMSGRAGGAAADDPEWFEIADAIGNVSERLAPALSSRLRLEVPAGLQPVWLPRAAFVQALGSLVKNALDASPEHLPVVVSASQDSDAIRVIVRDRGPGFPPEVLERAGEPFYTTKDAGRGLGLGLFLTRVFGERCGGTLTLASDDGATATLELPRRWPGQEAR